MAAAEEEDKRRAEQEAAAAAAAARRGSRRSSVTPGRPGSRRPSAAVVAGGPSAEGGWPMSALAWGRWLSGWLDEVRVAALCAHMQGSAPAWTCSLPSPPSCPRCLPAGAAALLPAGSQPPGPQAEPLCSHASFLDSLSREERRIIGGWVVA